MSNGKEGQANRGEFNVIHASISHFGRSGKFKEQMHSEMRRLLSGVSSQLSKQWLKPREVWKLLDVSPGKLHAMRISRPSVMRVGGVIYYDRVEIDKMFEKFKAAAVK